MNIVRGPGRRSVRSVFCSALLVAGAAFQLSALSAIQAHAATLIYADDFESDTIGSAPAGWTSVAGTWTVALDGSQVMKETDPNTAAAKTIVGGSPSWTDYSVQAQIKMGTAAWGTSNVLASRYKDVNNSYAIIFKDGRSWFFGKKVNGVWTSFASGGLSYNTTTWYNLEIDAAGSSLSAFINGNKVGSATDSTFSSGSIAIMSRYILEADNVVVNQLVPAPPTPTPTATPTPTPSGTPTPSPSGTPTPSPSGSPTPTPSGTPTPTPSPTPSPSPTPPPNPTTVVGVVTDSGTNAPIAGATVSTRPATAVATTDGSGNYSLSLPGGTYDVLFGAPGYNSDFVGGLSASSGGSVTVNMGLLPIPSATSEDFFSRPNQAGLGTASDGNAWLNDLSTYPRAQASIAGRQALVQTAVQLTDHDTWMGSAYRDEEVTADMNMANVVIDPSFQHGGRLLGRVQGNDSWLVMALNPSNNTLTIWVDAAGNWTQIGGVSITFSSGVWYHSKLDLIGSKVYGKAWAFGTPEPAWQVTGSQSSIMSPGVGGLRTGAADVYFANFVTTAITQISGQLTNSVTGSPIASAQVSLSNGATTATDSAGRYAFSGVAAGTYTVSGNQSGYNSNSTTASVSIGLSATGVNLALTPVPAPTSTPGPTPTPVGSPTPTPSATPHGG